MGSTIEPFDNILIIIPNVWKSGYLYEQKSYYNMKFDIVNGGCNWGLFE